MRDMIRANKLVTVNIQINTDTRKHRYGHIKQQSLTGFRQHVPNIVNCWFIE